MEVENITLVEHKIQIEKKKKEKKNSTLEINNLYIDNSSIHYTKFKYYIYEKKSK